MRPFTIWSGVGCVKMNRSRRGGRCAATEPLTTWSRGAATRPRKTWVRLVAVGAYKTLSGVGGGNGATQT